VTHRSLIVKNKMPKKLNFFESAIRSELKNYISSLDHSFSCCKGA